jgi:DinB superfamily
MTDQETTVRQASPLLLAHFDYVWGRVRGRLDGLPQDEYRWRPTPDCWDLREDGGGWEIERVVPDPVPGAVTTIAWRLWHIASECLAGYTANGLGPWPLDVKDRQWYPDVGPALAALDTAWDAFRSGIAALGEDGIWRKLGPDWGPYADDTWAALVLHAYDEVAHHGAEVALLRDLYARRVTENVDAPDSVV